MRDRSAAVFGLVGLSRDIFRVVVQAPLRAADLVGAHPVRDRNAAVFGLVGLSRDTSAS